MLQFSKYQGLGNDFLLLDWRSLGDGESFTPPEPALVRRLCDRRFGVGGDGMIVALPPEQGGELRMRIFNADGSEPEMCGNGIRCLARFLADSDGDRPGRRWLVETLAGPIVPELQADGSVRVDMGAPFLEPATVPTTLPVGENGLPQGELEVLGKRFAAAAAGMGNPHVVIPVEEVEVVDLERLGPALESHPAFPARTNVHFVQVLSPTHLVMRVWERGAGPTLACGTGACATLVAAHLLGLCEREARLDLPGGSLRIRWDEASGHVFMTGPAEPVFDGVLAPALLEVPPTSPPAPIAPRAVEDRGVEDRGVEDRVDGATVIDCATACVSGCQRPDDCSSAGARARVEALLADRSLDELVAIATQSAELRGHARRAPDGGSAR